MSYHVMGTGSRSMRTEPNAQSIFDTLLHHVSQLFDEHPDLVLISGMAEGWDEAIAKAALKLKIPWIAAIPTVTYGDYYWSERISLLKKDRTSEFKNLISKATEIVFVCDTLYINGVHANFVRNQWMVDKCDHALVYKPSSSGTRDALARLNSAKKTYSIYPFVEQTNLF